MTLSRLLYSIKKLLLLVVIIFFSYYNTFCINNLNYRFSKINIENGLSQNSILCIFKDSKGFLWFGTQNGLNKYDGYNFEIFKNNATNANSLSDNWILKIGEDLNGNLWIATLNGLNKLNPSTNEITRYFSEKNSNLRINTLVILDKTTLMIGTNSGLIKFNITKNMVSSHLLKKKSITSLLKDDKNDIWIGTRSGNIFKYSNQSEKIIPFLTKQNNNKPVTTIFQDREGYIYIGYFNSGLIKSNKEHINFQPLKIFKNLTVWTILQDKKGCFWIGTENNGAFLFNNSKLTNLNLSSGTIYDICQGDMSQIWIATLDDGVKKCMESPFNSFLNKKDIRCIFNNSNKNLWIGTRGEGLIIYNIENNNYEIIKNKKNTKNTLLSNIVWTILKANENEFWIGTSKGLNIFNRKNNTFTNLKDYTENKTPDNGDINCLFEDSKGFIWIGTWGGGLWQFNKKTKRLKVFENKDNNQNTISSNKISTIFQDSFNNLLVGSRGGIDIYNYEKDEFNHINKETYSSLSHNHISVIFEDSHSNLWLGTWGGGISIWNKNNRKNKIFKFDAIGKINNIISDQIACIIEDNEKNIWVSTDKGIYKINQKTKEITPFSVKDGLNNHDFNPKANCKLKNGEIYFGGIKGVTHFLPENILNDKFVPKVYITNFLLYNHKVFLNQQYQNQLSLKFKHNENYFTFEFSSLDYRSPENNRYLYKLEGFDENWIYSSAKQRRATYTNLNPGNYVFLLKGSSSKGKWNEKPLKWSLTIEPPFWKTLTFQFTFIFFTLLFVFLLYKKRTGYLKKQSNILQKLVNEQTIELKKQQEILKTQNIDLINLNNQKNEFLGIVVHDMRNPLYAISWLIDLNINKLNKINKNEIKDSVESLKIISNETENLKSIVNSLLDISAVEAGKLSLKKENFDFRDIVKNLKILLITQAENKKIHLSFKKNNSPLYIFADKLRLTEVVDNLVSNSIKYTYNSGNISVECELINELLIFKVVDDGQGLSENDLKNIFRFNHKLSAKPTAGETKTGFGLIIVKKIIELHDGKVTAFNNKEKGCTFKFEIPIN